MGRPKGFDRDELLQKVGEVFWTKGFADTSISDIEKASGVAKSGIYSEFKDKGDLYVSSLRYYMEHEGSLEHLTKHPLGWQNIEEHFRDCETESREDRGCFLSNTLRETAIIPEEANSLIRDYFEKTKVLFEKNLQACGYGSSSKVIAGMILTFALGLSLEQHMWSSDQLSNKIKEFLGQIQEMKK